MKAQGRGIVVSRILEGQEKCEFCAESATYVAMRGGRRTRGIHFACAAHRAQAQAAAIREG